MTAPTLTTSQTAAQTAISEWYASGKLAFLLSGGAGVGKTFLTSHLVSRFLAAGRTVVVAAPTHKACRVLRGKLDAAGIRWSFKPEKRENVPAGAAIVDTTAALLGVRPTITEDQTAEEQKFARTANGSLAKYLDANVPPGAVLVVDEVSMVARQDLLDLKAGLAARGARLLAVGDDAQLPPVKAEQIDFATDFDATFLLDEVVRQAKGSAIVTLAWDIRNGNLDAVETVQGSGIVRDDNVAAAYLASLKRPVEDERERSVFIAYTNRTVNAVNDAACTSLYGHGRQDFRAGELVLSTTPGFAEVRGTYVGRDGVRRVSKFTTQEQVVAVADQLRVDEISEDEDPVYGREVTLTRIDLPEGAKNRTFSSHYLSKEQLDNADHPFNVELRDLRAKAQDLQARYVEAKKAGKHSVAAALDPARKDAWSAYFKHEKSIISFAHPFAITSHKSQGSTYRAAYVAAAELRRYHRAALYVAVTRPSQELHL